MAAQDLIDERETAAAHDYPDLGGRLRAARRGRRLSVRELVKRLEVSPSLISQVETGRAQPSVSTLYSIAAELTVSLDDLLFIDGRRGSLNGTATFGGLAPAPASAPGGPVQRAADRKKIRLASPRHPGDAVSLESSAPHRLFNVGSEPVHAIWFVLGPQGVDAAAPPMHRDPHDA